MATTHAKNSARTTNKTAAAAALPVVPHAAPVAVLPLAVAPAAPGETVNNRAIGLLSSQQVNRAKAALEVNPMLCGLTLGAKPNQYQGGTSYRAQMVNAILGFVAANPGCTIAACLAGVQATLAPGAKGWGSVQLTAAQITGFLQPNGYIAYTML